MAAQAENLASRDNMVDAVARARLLASETHAALAGAPAADRQWFEEQVSFADNLVKRMVAQHAAWQATVVARSEALESREAAAYVGKIPGAPIHK